jgi:SOS-response transcriptional repressor LexA
MSELKDRLRVARVDARLTQAQLADKIGVSQTAINKIEIGATLKPRNLLEIASALNVDPTWLSRGEKRIILNEKNHIGGLNRRSSVIIKNTSSDKIEHLMMPVISWVQAGTWCESVLFSTIEDEFTEWYPCPEKHSPQAFALKVRGESMYPDFIDGDIIYVDPEVKAENGSCVIIIQNGDTEATFKQLIVDGSNRYLKALNPNWPTQFIEVLPDARICGVVIGSYRKRN